MLTNEQAAREITTQILTENIPNVGIAADALAASIIAALAEVELIPDDEAIRIGDVVYDGAVVVQALKCNKCESRVPHEHCEPFAKVGPNRWVNVKFLKKVGA